MMTTWYEADADLMGSGYDTCGHRHKTPQAAGKCLGKVPQRPFGRGPIIGMENAFSMARIRMYVDGIETEWHYAESE